MRVSEAIASRRTCRAFLDTPIPEQTVREILQGATRTPSGGNLQPWHVAVATGQALSDLKAKVTDNIAKGHYLDDPMEYQIYPPDLGEPYLGRRERVGEQLYDSIGIARDDGGARYRQVLRNYALFDAPVGVFLFLDRTSLQGQWADMGLFLQSFMLLARETGLHTAPLESWALWHRTVRSALGVPDNLMLYCGVALGHMDEAAPINKWQAERAGLDEFARFHGF
jgi:nitroreductase